MISASPKKTGGDKHWLVMNEHGERFGPVTFETLKLWAQDGRLAPTNTASEDEKTWTPVPEIDGLEMDWVAEVSPGAFYGPIHKEALEALKKEGAIPAQAVTFQRSQVNRILSKTQAIPPPPAPPAKKEESEAVQALERQLALERQRSHEIGQQLQEAERRVATSDARVEASEQKQTLYAAQTEQAQQQLAAQLDQTHQQLAQIQTQLLAREQELQRHEQRLTGVERLEPLLQTVLAKVENQHQELKSSLCTIPANATLSSEHVEVLMSVERLEPLLQKHLAKLENQQQELKTSLGSLPVSTTLSSEHVEVLMRDNFSKVIHAQQELKQAVATTQEGVALSTERVELLVKDLLSKLTHHQQEFKQAVVTTQETVSRATERSAALVTESMAHLNALQKDKTIELLLEKHFTQLAATFNTAQEHLSASLTHLLKQEVHPLLQQFSVQDQALQHLKAEIKTVVPQVTGHVTSGVAELLDKNLAAMTQRLHADLAQGREHLSEQTQASLNHVQEQLMRATGESQRLAIEYIVRELTTLMNQATQAGRDAFLQSVQKGWSGLQQQAATVESQLKQLGEVQQRLHHELKVVLEKQQATPPPPTVKRTVVEAEVVEVPPSERHPKKTKPATEAPEPPPHKAEAPAAQPSAGLSMADIEQQARRELERLGAQGMNIFKRKS